MQPLVPYLGRLLGTRDARLHLAGGRWSVSRASLYCNAYTAAAAALSLIGRLPVREELTLFPLDAYLRGRHRWQVAKKLHSAGIVAWHHVLVRRLAGIMLDRINFVIRLRCVYESQLVSGLNRVEEGPSRGLPRCVPSASSTLIDGISSVLMTSLAR